MAWICTYVLLRKIFSDSTTRVLFGLCIRFDCWALHLVYCYNCYAHLENHKNTNGFNIFQAALPLAFGIKSDGLL